MSVIETKDSAAKPSWNHRCTATFCHLRASAALLHGLHSEEPYHIVLTFAMSNTLNKAKVYMHYWPIVTWGHDFT